MRIGRLRRHSVGAAVALATLLLLATGCAERYGDDVRPDGTQDIPQNALAPTAGSPAVEQDQLWDWVLPIAIIVGVLVLGAVGFAMWRYRAKPDKDMGIPKQVAGNTLLEVTWTLIPALILAGIAVPTVGTIFALAEESPDALNVNVIGKQYWWEFEYPDEELVDPETNETVITAFELVIPTGREVQLDMYATSAAQPFDPGAIEGAPEGPAAAGVIHSFWVPRLAGKQDVVPGNVREMKISADEPGYYLGQCAEFCGLSHANMRFAVRAVPPDEFERYIADQHEPAEVLTDGLAAQGQQVFTEAGCQACHAIDGYPAGGLPDGEPLPLVQEDEESGEFVSAQPRIAPNLTHLQTREYFASFVEMTDENLAAWLEDPQRVKPGAQMPNLGLSDEQVTALVAYLNTLD